MHNKKRILASFLIILFVAIFMLIFAYKKKDQLLFNHFVKEYIQNTLSENALDLHYTLKEPSLYGIYEATSLPIYQPKDALNAYQSLQDTLFSLKKIDSLALSKEQYFTYLVLQDYLTECLEAEKYPYFPEPFTPNSGVHTTLPILLAEYTFYDTNDIKVYFDILSAIPAYFEGLLLYETEKADAGFFMNSTALDKVVSACQEFTNCDDISSHLLVSTFEQRLIDFSNTYSTLSSQDMEDYLKKNELLIYNIVFPAYNSLAKELTALSSYCNNNYHGLCSYPNGKQYYLALLKRSTGSYRSISDIKEMLFSDFEKNYTQLVNLLAQNPQILEDDCFTDFDEQFPLKDSNEILSYLQSAISDDFPVLSQDTTVSVKILSDTLEDYCSPAFYLTVPLDNWKDNVIYINNKNALSGIDLFSTLAHEGFPGHLYQTVFYHQTSTNSLKTDTLAVTPNKLLRNTLYFGGYTEGYALYVESLSYDYALALCKNANISNAEVLCNVLKCEWQMQIGLYCLLDIAIHYDGANYEQIKALLNKFGIIDDTSVDIIYQYLLEEPTTYLKYYLGYLEINALKQQAKNLWADNYSDLKFHTFLLTTGPCNFQCLTKKLEEE